MGEPCLNCWGDPVVLPRSSGSVQGSRSISILPGRSRNLRNVERMIKANLGKPAQQEKALGRFIASLTQDDIYNLRRNIYQRHDFSVSDAS